VRALFAAALILSAAFPRPTLAATPTEDPELADGLHCVQPVQIPLVQNVMEAQWSPDGHTLGLVWFSRLPSPRSPTGWREVEIVDSLDVKTGRLWPIGVGDEVDWSGTGKYLSYWGPNAEELRVMHEDRVVARLSPTIPRVRWVGDGLLFIEKNLLKEWRDGTVHTVGLFAQNYVPRYPRDDVYFSGDGTQMTITRYSQDGTIERFIGETATVDFQPLETDDARYIEWAPNGHALLVRDVDRVELHDAETGTRVVTGAFAQAAVHQWAPDGRTLLLGKVSPTMPGGNAFDGFRPIDTPASAPALATLPNVLGARAFSADGKYFVGVSRTAADTTRLEVYRCIGAPTGAMPTSDAAERVAKMNEGPGRFVRPTAGEISQFITRTHTGIDLATPFGSLITADDDGVITFVEWVPTGGNRVCIQHRGALESCVYHTSLPLVRTGERVVRGQPIALIGMTGVVTGPHTHWEVKLSGRIVDPLTF
jgi:murein DD-endopeptidase MepM/ murein hydrolase activator NlpD